MQKLSDNPMYKYLMVLVICSTAGLNAWMGLYTNYATDVVGVNGKNFS